MRPIRKAELKEAIRRVDSLLRKRPNCETIRETMRQAVELIRGSIGDMRSEARELTIRIGWKEEAMAAATTILNEVDPDTIVNTVLALGYMQEVDHTRFPDDEAFKFAVSRRLWVLAPGSKRAYRSRTTGAVTRVPNDMRPRVARQVGQFFAPLSSLALKLRELELREQEKAAKASPAALMALLDNKGAA